MRNLLSIAGCALLVGCSVTFDVDTNGSFTVELGDFDKNCTLEETTFEVDPAGTCAISHTLVGDVCQVRANCAGLNLIDVEAITEQIDDVIGGDSNIRAEVDSLKLDGTDFEFLPERPDVLAFDVALTSVKDSESPLDIASVDLAMLERIEGGDEVTIFEGDATDPFLTQVNESIADETVLPVDGFIAVDVPIQEVRDKLVGETVTASIDYNVDAVGRGSLCLFGCN